jgi:hypothetical protein
MKFSFNLCAIEIIALCFVIPTILVSFYETAEFKVRFYEWRKIIGGICMAFWIVVIPLAIWSDRKGLRKLLFGIPIFIGISSVLGEIEP